MTFFPDSIFAEMIPQHCKLSVQEITLHCSNFHEAIEDIIVHILNLDAGKENHKHLGCTRVRMFAVGVRFVGSEGRGTK